MRSSVQHTARVCLELPLGTRQSGGTIANIHEANPAVAKVPLCRQNNLEYGEALLNMCY